MDAQPVNALFHEHLVVFIVLRLIVLRSLIILELILTSLLPIVVVIRSCITNTGAGTVIRT